MSAATERAAQALLDILEEHRIGARLTMDDARLIVDRMEDAGVLTLGSGQREPKAAKVTKMRFQ